MEASNEKRTLSLQQFSEDGAAEAAEAQTVDRAASDSPKEETPQADEPERPQQD